MLMTSDNVQLPSASYLPVLPLMASYLGRITSTVSTVPLRRSILSHTTFALPCELEVKAEIPGINTENLETTTKTKGATTVDWLAILAEAFSAAIAKTPYITGDATERCTGRGCVNLICFDKSCASEDHKCGQDSEFHVL